MRDVCKVYALYSERDGIVRYVGQTMDDVAERVRTHFGTARQTKKTAVGEWISQEWADGFRVKFKTLDANAEWNVTERKFIATYRDLGVPLLNKTRGGGPSSPLDKHHEVSSEARAALAKAWETRVPCSDATRLKRMLAADETRKRRARAIDYSYVGVGVGIGGGKCRVSR